MRVYISTGKILDYYGTWENMEADTGYSVVTIKKLCTMGAEEKHIREKYPLVLHTLDMDRVPRKKDKDVKPHPGACFACIHKEKGTCVKYKKIIYEACVKCKKPTKRAGNSIEYAVNGRVL